MGLLDEAIRDHLELKRRSGADPSEIAREEREALEPVFPDEPRPDAFDGDPQAALTDGEPPHGDPLADVVGAPAQPVHEEGAYAEPPSPLGQETAELDMQAVLDQDARLAEAAAGGPSPGAPGAVPGEHPQATADDELLEWEMPPRPDDEQPPQPLPGQERLSFE
ncbi:MAG TPA: hypothetical protein VH061_10615 [Solirubrobacteraceae bacterium]|jgi:hypothetical protein|nr:hypothetical protein [Solirubrobacteraceae bacterium]